MDAQLYIRGKVFPNPIQYELFEILRKENSVEGLIDYIHDMLEKENAELEEHRLEIERLREMSNEVAKLHKVIEGYEHLIDSNKLKVSLEEFIKTFKEKNDRYPSLDETWEFARSPFIPKRNPELFSKKK